jgi:hypothetical protein
MSNDSPSADSFRKWTKDHLRNLKDLKKQLTKSDDVDALLKSLDPEAWRALRKKARQLKAGSRTADSFKNKVSKEIDKDTKRFTKILEQLQAK